MDEDLKLYIPLGVKPEAELFTGFGKKQLFQSIVGSLVMGGIAALAWLFTGNVTTTVRAGRCICGNNIHRNINAARDGNTHCQRYLCSAWQVRAK